MITEKAWRVSIALHLGIVAMAFCVLPLGLVYAQDFKAVERRLGGAVEAGELTLEQASIMMNTLKRSTGSEHAHVRTMEAKKRRYMEFAKEIHVAVKSGNLSEEEAEKKLIELRKEMFRSGDRKGAKQYNDPDMAGKRRRYVEGAKQIKAAVEAGKISEEAADKRLIEMRAMIFRGVGWKDRDNGKDIAALKRRYEEGTKRIKAAVEAGRITKEDAEKRLIEMRKSLFGDNKQGPDVDKQMEAKKHRYMEFAKEIKAAVDAGKLSKEDAEKKLIGLRKEMFSDGD